jgi:hypothetical protein
MHGGRYEERAMKYPKHVMAIKPGYRWESGRHHVGFLRVETDLPLPGSPDHDEKEFGGGSSSYVPQEKDKDVQILYGLDLFRGKKSFETEAKKSSIN